MKEKKSGFQRYFVFKVSAVVLSALLLVGPAQGFYPEGSAVQGAGVGFEAALKAYQKGLYKQAAANLQQLLKLKEAGDPEFKAKVYLLMAACYEKLENRDKARGHYLALKGMFEDGLIDQIPVVAGVDTGALSVYREVFEESYFKFKKPVAAAERLKKSVVHAPRKSIETKAKEKKKKKFPLLIVIGSIVIIGTAAVLLFTQVVKKKKKKEEESTIPKITWVRVRAGEFLMGDNFNEGEADELPVHKVYLDDYYITCYEVTNEQYMAFCQDTGREYFSDYGPMYPAANVTWYDARDFCTWISGKTGENIKLPTEAQWEKAARSYEQNRYPWGNNKPTCYLANFFGCGNSSDQPGYLTPVNDRPDGMSLYSASNMAGNVSEWCRGWYSASYYSVSPGKNPLGPANGSCRVVRGGDITSSAFDIRSANRDCKAPGYAGEALGFRIVKEGTN